MKKNRLYILVVLLSLITCLSSCITSEETNYLQDIKKSYTPTKFEAYKLAQGDYITCAVLTGDREFAVSLQGLVSNHRGQAISYVIYEDGTIILPYLGPVKVEGLTVQEAELKLQDVIQEAVVDAQVHLTMPANVFYVLADGKKGSYHLYKDNLTIYQALAISEQTTETMDISKVSILRKKEDGQTDVKTFDLRTEGVIQSEFYFIKPNDLIYFPTNKNSFFNISSLGTFITSVTVPLTLLIYVSTVKF